MTEQVVSVCMSAIMPELRPTTSAYDSIAESTAAVVALPGRKLVIETMS